MHTKRALVFTLILSACGNAESERSENEPIVATETQRAIANSASNAAARAAAEAPSTAPSVAAPTTPTTVAPSVDTAVVGSAEDFLASDLVVGLKPVRAVIAEDVVERSPVREGVAFPSNYTGRLYAFIELQNPSRAANKIKVYWLRPNGSRHGEVSLDVGTQISWRTWAYTGHARTPGTWTAVFETEDGQLLAKKTFTIQ